MKLLTITQAADRMGIKPKTLRNWLALRKIAHVKVGRFTRISEQAIQDWIEGHTVNAERE